MKKRVVLHKQIGETPLQTIQEWKRTHEPYKDVAASYAGRLDPMASGKLLVLLGNECKKQPLYTGLDKCYEVEVLLDLKSDTGDVLGLPAYSHIVAEPSKERMEQALLKELGTHTLPYPAYSSKTVDGKPLFTYALAGTLGTIVVPTHDETFYRINLIKQNTLSKEALQTRIRTTLQKVPRSSEPSKAAGADFRQDAIRPAWDALFSTMEERSFTVLTLRVTAGSGAYMRTLSERIGATLKTSALALSIHRTRIGTYKPIPLLGGFWLRSY